MEILVAKASELIENGDYILEENNFLWHEFEDKFSQLAQEALTTLKASAQKDQLALVENKITDLADLKVNFFTNVINLPFSDAKKYVDFFADGAQVPVKFYFSVASPDVNKSKLWIEEINEKNANWQKILELLPQAHQNMMEKQEKLADEKSSKE